MNRKRALKGGQETSRALNRRAVFSLLRAESGLSRADLASRTGLSRAAITGVVNEMIGEGLLREGRPSAGPPGRRPIPLEICYEARQAVGVRVLGRALECVLTDLSTRVLAKTVVPLEDSTPAGLVEAIVTAVVRLGRTEAAVGSRITGVGVGIPGAVQADTGKVLRSFRLGWRNVQLARMLAKRIDLPVWVDDDTHSFALAQHLFGIGQHRGTVAVLAIGEGLGAATIVDGGLHRGDHGAAGKIGHVQLTKDGPLCECGRIGCLQAHHAEGGILARWGRGNRKALLAAVRAGEPDALHVLEEAGTEIGRVVAVYCTVIDPSVLVIGGEATEFGDALLKPLGDALRQYAIADHIEIILDWDETSWARGAAALATQRLFDFEAIQGAIASSPGVGSAAPETGPGPKMAGRIPLGSGGQGNRIRYP